MQSHECLVRHLEQFSAVWFTESTLSFVGDSGAPDRYHSRCGHGALYTLLDPAMVQNQ
jgi:hypothetical protein